MMWPAGQGLGFEDNFGYHQIPIPNREAGKLNENVGIRKAIQALLPKSII